MRRLPHGYTNQTAGDGTIVVKAYDGPDSSRREARERIALSTLAGIIPVPPLLDTRGNDARNADAAGGDATGHGTARLRLGFVAGAHAQELLAPDVPESVAAGVLTVCGAVLRRIHSVDPGQLLRAGLDRPAGTIAHPVVVHGDFGPNNLLLDPHCLTVTAVLDWEFVHVGEPVEDLAWCEWIVRTHHPDRIPLLPAFFEAYGNDTPPWHVRREAMLDACRRLLEFTTRWDPHGSGVTLWERRLAETARWDG